MCVSACVVFEYFIYIYIYISFETGYQVKSLKETTRVLVRMMMMKERMTRNGTTTVPQCFTHAWHTHKLQCVLMSVGGKWM
jgi:hypothetical protein